MDIPGDSYNASASPSSHPIVCAIVTYGGASAAQPLVETVMRAGVPSSAIVVVDNPRSGSERAAGLPVHERALPRNVGFAAALHEALPLVVRPETELLLLATPDIAAGPAALTALFDAARRSSVHGLLGPVIRHPGSAEPMSYGGLIGTRGGAGHRTAAGATGEQIEDCDWVDGALMLVRRRAWDELGGMDGRYFLYFEDVDFCVRAGRAGWRIGVVPAAVVEQAPGLMRRLGAFGYLAARNGLAVRRCYGGARAVAAGIASELVRASRAVPASPRYSAGVLTGIADFLRGRYGPPPAWLADDISAT
jgi:GT2 family glycosyltransferase